MQNTVLPLLMQVRCGICSGTTYEPIYSCTVNYPLPAPVLTFFVIFMFGSKSNEVSKDVVKYSPQIIVGR
jgi:hypothetical protein